MKRRDAKVSLLSLVKDKGFQDEKEMDVLFVFVAAMRLLHRAGGQI